MNYFLILPRRKYNLQYYYIKLRDIVKDFMSLKFVEANKLVLKPKKSSFTYFMILIGNIAQLKDTPNAQTLLRKLLIKK
jgi:hypothetical protein